MLGSFAGESAARAFALGLALLVQPQALQIPAPRGFVNDFADVIPEESEQRIQQIILDVRAKSGGDIAVVTLPRLGDRSLEETATQILRQWGVGSAGRPGDPRRNVGVVILIVPKETSGEARTRGRIEVGSGAEGFVTDAASGAILDEAGPLFRASRYGPALELVTQRVAELFAREFGFTQDTAVRVRPPVDLPAQAPAARRQGIPPILIILFIFLVFSMLSGRARRRGRRRSGCGGCLPIFIPMGGGWGGGGWHGGRGGWGGRGGGGGFGGGFGGGGFGGFGGFGGGGGGFGGGASRSW